MSTLAERQEAFLAALLDERAPPPRGWGNSQASGMGVYRGNYRSALMAVLAETYARTRGYVGEAPFRRVSMHHVITHPPAGWSIDEAGAGFDATCAQLFADNPEVAELAWLEWTMQALATAPDCDAMTAQAFAAQTAGFGDAGWMGLRLALQPRAEARLVAHDLAALWRAQDENSDGDLLADAQGAAPRCCLAWREGERPTFLMLDAAHAPAFAAMQGGASYGEMIALLAGEDHDPEAIQRAAQTAGAMLGTWLTEGLITGLT